MVLGRLILSWLVMKADPFLSDPVLTGPPMVNLEVGGPDGGCSFLSWNRRDWSFLGRSRKTDSFLAHLEADPFAVGLDQAGPFLADQGKLVLYTDFWETGQRQASPLLFY